MFFRYDKAIHSNIFNSILRANIADRPQMILSLSKGRVVVMLRAIGQGIFVILRMILSEM